MIMVAVELVAVADRFYIENLTICAGDTRTVSILLDNETEYTAFQSDLYLPEELTATGFTLTSRKHSSHTLSVSTLPDGGIRLLSYSVKVKPYSENSGALVSFSVTAHEDFTGPATIVVCNTLFTTLTGIEVPLADEACTVRLGLKGDVNCDGLVDINDVTMMIDYVLGKPMENFNTYNGDFNSDGDIDINDVCDTIERVLGIR